MWFPFLCLALGLLVAGWLMPWAELAMRWGLYLLLLGLGAKVGSNEELLKVVPVLGIKSLGLCLASSLGSILLVGAWERGFSPKRQGGKNQKDRGNDNVFLRTEYVFAGKVFLFLTLGCLLGLYLDPKAILLDRTVTFSLFVIYVAVGIGMREGLAELKNTKIGGSILVVPVLALVGSVLITCAIAKGLGFKIIHAAAVSSGMGYYSLTAAMITQKVNPEMGFVAFISNFLREVLTLLVTPFLTRFTRLGTVALGGATTMDTTLAVMKQYLSEKEVFVAFASGVLLTLAVPFILMLILSLG